MLPPELRYALDVRWASDNSVFLGLKTAGTVEVGVDGRNTAPKVLIPGKTSPGGFWMSWNVASSPEYLVASSSFFVLTWRPVQSPERKEATFEAIHDIDLKGGRLAIVGAQRDAHTVFAPEGAIAWIGSLEKSLADLKPLVFDVKGAGAPTFNNCLAHNLGVTRFLNDGSLIVVPGVQPDVYHFDVNDKLLEVTDTAALGIDTDCGGLSPELVTQMKAHFARRHAWINERRTLDEILPLADGPGLLVRSVSGGHTYWVLKVMHADRAVATYDVPLRSEGPLAHIKGDVRGGRLVLLLWEHSSDGKSEGAPAPHLVLAALPGS